MKTLLLLSLLSISLGCGMSGHGTSQGCTTVRGDNAVTLMECLDHGLVYSFSKNIIVNTAERRVQNATLNWMIDERPLNPTTKGCEELQLEDVQHVLTSERDSFLAHLFAVRDSSAFGDGHGAIVYDLLSAPDLAPEGLVWLNKAVLLGIPKDPPVVRECDMLTLITNEPDKWVLTFRAVANLAAVNLGDEQVYSPALGALGLARLGHIEDARRSLLRAAQSAQNQTQKAVIERLIDHLNDVPNPHTDLRQLVEETLGLSACL